MLHHLVCILLCLSVLVNAAADADNSAPQPLHRQFSDRKEKDAFVQELRSVILRHKPELPEPPRELGVHTPCKKFGLGCPEGYVRFLEELAQPYHHDPEQQQDHQQEQQPTTTQSSAAHHHGQQEGVKATAAVDTASIAASTAAAPLSLWSPAEAERIEKLQRLVRVWEAKLEKLTMQPVDAVVDASGRLRVGGDGDVGFYWWSLQRCGQWYLSAWMAAALVAGEDVVVRVVGQWLWWRLLPCALLVTVLMWVWASGPPLPAEVLRFIVATREASDDAAADDDYDEDPSDTTCDGGQPLSSDAHAVPDEAGDDEHNNTTSSPPSAEADEAASLRKRMREVASFTLLDNHLQHHGAFVILKLRVVLSCYVLLLLAWTCVIFLRQVHGATTMSDSTSSSVSGISRLVATVSSRILPSWLVASGAMYVAMGYLGGVLIMAGKSAMDAFEDLMHVQDACAAAQSEVLRSVYEVQE